MSSTLCGAAPRSVHALLRLRSGQQPLLRNAVRTASVPLWSPHRRCLSTAPGPLQAPPRKPVINAEDEAHIVKSPYTEVEIPEMNLADFVWKDVQKWPDNLALVSIIRQI